MTERGDDVMGKPQKRTGRQLCATFQVRLRAQCKAHKRRLELRRVCAVPSRAVPCRAVPSRAVPCRAVPESCAVPGSRAVPESRAVPCQSAAQRGEEWPGGTCPRQARSQQLGGRPWGASRKPRAAARCWTPPQRPARPPPAEVAPGSRKAAQTPVRT